MLASQRDLGTCTLLSVARRGKGETLHSPDVVFWRADPSCVDDGVVEDGREVRRLVEVSPQFSDGRFIETRSTRQGCIDRQYHVEHITSDDSRPAIRAGNVRIRLVMCRKIARTASPVRVRGSFDETCDSVSAVIGFTSSSQRTARSSLDLNHIHERFFVAKR